LSKVEVVPAPDLAEPLALLEESFRDGEPVPRPFAEILRRSVEAGNIEILAAQTEARTLGVLVLAYRPNISACALFASIEDLYVRPEARRVGVGKALLTAAHKRCAARKISYVEVQVEDRAAEAFYTALGYESETGVRVLSRSLVIDDQTDRADR
jgi:ribosomal protein S18 acetylase RimI-like enzyme